MKNKLRQLFMMIKRNPYTAVLIFIAALLHFSIILPSGSHYCFSGFCGDYYWGVHEHDGLWHIAVAEAAFKTYPLLNPSYSGSFLFGYNILLDYVIYFLGLIGISSLFVYFKLLPIIWFGLFTYSLIRFIRIFSKSKLAHFVFLLLSYFGTSFGFIIPLIQNHRFEGINAITIMQPILTLTNLQLAFSYISIMWVVILIFETKKDVYKISFISLFLFISWGLKFYSGFLVSIVIGVYYFVEAIKERKYRYFLWIVVFFLVSLGSILWIYNPFSAGASKGSPFTFKPLALVWPYIENTDSFFYSPYWANAKYIFLNNSKISPRFLLFELLLACSYLFFNFGMRFFGIFYFVKNKVRTIDISIVCAIVIGILASLLLVQKGVWWNVVQFLYIVSFLLNIYAALFISSIKKGAIRVVFIFLIIITTLPYVVDSVRPYISSGYNYVSDTEKKALLYLRNSKPGVVYSPLFSKSFPKNTKVNSLWAVSDDSYISAYSGKQMYLQVTGAILLSSDYVEREKNIKEGSCNIINDIQYVYYHKDAIDTFIRKCIAKNSAFTRIYTEGGYSIYSRRE